MEPKMGQFLATNPNPVLSAGKDGIVLYSNEAGELLLREWNVKIGEKLPSDIIDFVQKVISQNRPEKIEVKAGNRTYSAAFHPSSEEEYVNIYGFDISDLIELEEKPRESEALNMMKPELADIIDSQAIQSLMNDFYRLAHIPMSIDDLRGNVLVGVGWQDICTKFHMINPETRKNCFESSTTLAEDVLYGEFEQYKCKNNMWHIATPIMVGGQHVGNIISGQFFFEDEPLEYELFRSKARKYGFNEEEYIAALEKVPLLSREAVNTGMSFFMKLANMISQLSYSNVKLDRSLSKSDTLLLALQKSESKYRQIIETANEGVWVFNSVSETTYVNDKMADMLGYSREEMVGSFIWDYADEEDKNFFQVRLANRKQGIDEVYECKLIRKDGSILWLLVSAKASFDKDDKFAGSLGMFTDITERKRAEEEGQGTRNMLQLIMNNIPQGIFWKDRNSRYIGCNKIFARATGVESPENIIGKTDYDLPWSPEQTEWFREYDRRIMENGTPEYHIVESQQKADGEMAWVETNKIPLHDAKGNVIGILGTYEDITERKKAEEAIRLSNKYNRSLIEASLDPLVTIGRNGKITDVNSATEQVTGYSRNDLIGTDFSDYFTEPEKARFGYKQVFTYGKVRNYPLEIRSKDGNITPVLYNASVYRDENNEVVGVFAAARDITERKKVEAKLKEIYENLEKLVHERTSELKKAYSSLKKSEEGFAEAQKMAHIGNWEWEIENDKAYWSEEMYRIFKRDPQELAPSYNEYLSYIHPEDLEYYCNALKTAEYGSIFSIDYRIVLANGEERTVHLKSEFVFNDANLPIRIKGTVQDITESKKTEEDIKTLANAVESSDDAIVTESFDGIIRSWNKGAVQIYGYSAEEVLGKNASILEPENINGEIKQLIERVQKGKKIRHFETSRLRKDGITINASVTLSPIFDIHGKFKAVSCITKDITESIKAKEALRLSNIYNRSLFEASLDPLVTIGHNGKITDLNTAMELATSYSRNELIGTDFMNYFTEPEKARDVYQQAFMEGFISDYMLEILNRNGSITPVLSNASVYMDESGGVIGVFVAARDITDRLKAQEKIQILASVVESSSDAIGTISLEGTFTSWNKGAEKVYGYSAEEILGKPTSFVAPSHLDDETKQKIELLKQGRIVNNYETLRLRKDGKIIDVSITLSPVYDLHGKLIAISFISRDITERKIVDEKLRESEEKYRNIVETANEGILIIDDEARVTFANKKLTDMLGYTQKEGICRPIRDFTDEEGKAILKLNLEKRRQGIDGTYELKLICKDGSVLWVLISAKPLLDKNGKYVGSLSMLTNITEHKKAEEELRKSEGKYRNIVETANEGIWIHNAEARTTYVNKKMSEMLGYSPEELIDRFILDFISEESKTTTKLKLKNRRLGINESFELKLICKDGSVLWVLISAKSLFDNDGKFAGTLSMLTDITKRKEAEEILKLRLEELTRSNAELEQFAYVSSHDLQEPLRMITSYLQLLQRRYQGNIDERADKYIKFAVDGAFRMQNLINDLLELSRVTTRASKYEPTNCEFVLNQVLSGLELYIKENNATVTHNPLPEVMADNTQLAQVFQNLVINGIKFHSEEAPRIHISAEKTANEWVFSVQDNGIGIDQQYSEKIFEVFKRLQKKEEYSGTGIGLSVCKKIVERHSGRIWVESELGKGSTFYFTFPVNSI